MYHPMLINPVASQIVDTRRRAAGAQRTVRSPKSRLWIKSVRLGRSA
jgi:hypothetical protein